MRMSKRLPAVLAAILAVSLCGCDNAAAGGTEQSAQTTEEAAVSEPTYLSAADEYAWGNVEIVGGGYTVGIYYNPAEEGLIYARTDIGGAYRMDKASGRWVPLTDEFDEDNYTYYGIDGLVTDPVEPNKVYLLAGMYGDWNAAVLRSEDYGANWAITPLEFSAGGNEPNRFADRLVMDPADNKTLYVGSRDSGLWVSHDSGASFAKIDSFPTLGLEYREDGYNFGITAIAFDPTSGSNGMPCSTIFVGTGDRVNYRSDDGGVTWSEMDGLPKNLLTYHIDVSGDNVYFTMGNKSGPYQVNKGALRCYSIKTGEVTDLTPEATGHGFGDLAIDPKNPELMYLSSMGKWGGEENDTIFRTTDGGKTWEALFTGDGADKLFEVDYSGAPWLTWGNDNAKLGWMMGCLAINPFNNDQMMYGTGATIYRSENLTKWGSEMIRFVVNCAGLEETAVLDLDAANSDEISLYSAMGDIDGFSHKDVTVVPDKLNGNGSMTTSTGISCAYGNPAVVARCGGGSSPVSVSQDYGQTWTDSRVPDKSGKNGTIEVNADGSSIYWSAEKATVIYRSDDFGATWTALEKVFVSPNMETDKFNPDVFYVFTSGTLYVSKDRGATFTVSKEMTPDKSTIVSDPSTEGVVWLASLYGGIYKLDEYGLGALTKVGMQSAERMAFGAAKDENSPLSMYAIGMSEKQYGIWRSIDGGTTWERINDDKHWFGAIGDSLAADYKVYGRVYFGTNGRGIIMGSLK